MKSNIIKWGKDNYFYSDTVFTPRDSSLFFIDQVDSYLKSISSKQLPIIDLCCGIGAIGISVYKSFNDRFNFFVGLDIDKSAIDICNKNIRYHNINGIANFWNAGDKISIPSEGIAVCNPPFLPIENISQKTVTKTEQIASGNLGLDVTLKCFGSLKGTNIVLILKSLNWQIPHIINNVKQDYSLVNKSEYKIEDNYTIAYSIWEPVK